MPRTLPADRLELLWSFLVRNALGVTLKEFNGELNEPVSRSTFYRMIARLRETKRARIEYAIPRRTGSAPSRPRSNSLAPRWRIMDGAALDSKTHRFTGLWHSAGALFALVATFRLLRCFRQGVLAEFINKEVAAELEDHLDRQRPGAARHLRRVKVEPLGEVDVELESFEAVCTALFERKRLRITHESLIDGHRSERDVSPQRLLRYRDNWFLDTYCHRKKEIRTFELGGLTAARLSDDTRRAVDIPDEKLDEAFDAGYGIYAGKDVKRARLRFSWPASIRASKARWHPSQTVTLHPKNGREPYECTLTVPYSRSPELVMDILRWGPNVKVLGPAELRRAVSTQLQTALARYRAAAHGRQP